MDNRTALTRSCLLIAVLAACPASALAYVGPGAGLSVIGSLLAFIAAIVVAIFGFLFFPIRRLLRKRRRKAEITLANKESRSPVGGVQDPHAEHRSKPDSAHGHDEK